MNIDLVIKESKIEGKGVFANRDFKKGEVVNRWDTSHILAESQIQDLPEDQRNRVSCIGDGRYVLLQEPERYVNHSCDPNTFVKDQAEVALRDISKDEEITCDYSLEGVDEWEFPCNCKIANCRVTVYGDFSKLDSDTRKRLEPLRQGWHR
ncbi:MAG: SET domain-containing protein-lysine N-methyltransferase [Nanoarchaeota archaeon]